MPRIALRSLLVHLSLGKNEVSIRKIGRFLMYFLELFQILTRRSLFWLRFRDALLFLLFY